MTRKKLTCVICPKGCTLEAMLDGMEFLSVSGQDCDRGTRYAQKELTNPTRMVTTTVQVAGSQNGTVRLPCKTSSDVPKHRMFAVLREAAEVIAFPPVKIGDVLKANVADTGVDLIAAKDIE